MDRNSLQWALRPAGAVGVAIVLMGVALLENTVAPWAPFYIVYAAAATVIPFVLGTYAFGPFRAVRVRSWLLGVVAAVALQVFGGLLIGVVYAGVLGALGVPEGALSEPFYSVDAALGSMFQVAADRLGAAVGGIRVAYLGFILLWAGFGEEMFYRGYVHGTLAKSRGFAVAASVSAALFAVRHATQLALLWPDYPWPAAGAWVAFAFFVGFFLSALYHRTRSLYLPIGIHYMFNLIPVVAALVSPTTP